MRIAACQVVFDGVNRGGWQEVGTMALFLPAMGVLICLCQAYDQIIKKL